MSDFYKDAIARLDEGVKADCGKYGNHMKKDVRDALAEFCRQDGEFAQAVAQGGDFRDCMEAVSKGVKGGSISDMKAFGLAVEFYFPGAGINVTMAIDLCASVKGAAGHEKTTAAGPVIDLSAFF